MGRRIRLLTFNLATGVDDTNAWRDRALDPHVDEINDIDPDIVFAQEVDRNTGRTGLDQIEVLTSRTNLKHAVFHGRPYDGGQHGTAVLSRFPLKELPGLSVTSELPAPKFWSRYQRADENVSRGVLSLYGVNVLMCSVHYPHVVPELITSDVDYHQRHMSEVLAKMHDDDPMDTVIGGDYNTTTDYASMAPLRVKFYDPEMTVTPEARGYQKPAPLTDEGLDHIMVTGRNLTVPDLALLDNVRDGTQFTDHPLLVATLVIEPPFEPLFRAVSDWCAQSNGAYGAGWPVSGLVFEPGMHFAAGLLRPEAVDFRDVPFAEAPSNDARTRFTAAHDWAQAHGYATGFPNFHAGGGGPNGTFGGVLLVKQGVGTFLDVNVSALGLPDPPFDTPMDRWLEAVDRWAQNSGWVTAIPTGHVGYSENDYNPGSVIGVHLFSAAVADRQVLPWPEDVPVKA